MRKPLKQMLLNENILKNNCFKLKHRTHYPYRCVLCADALHERNYSWICSRCRSKYKVKDWFICIIKDLDHKKVIYLNNN